LRLEEVMLRSMLALSLSVGFGLGQSIFSAPAPQTMTLEEVALLVRLGAPAERIKAVSKRYGFNFPVEKNLVSLQRVGASQDLIADLLVIQNSVPPKLVLSAQPKRNLPGRQVTLRWKSEDAAYLALFPTAEEVALAGERAVMLQPGDNSFEFVACFGGAVTRKVLNVKAVSPLATGGKIVWEGNVAQGGEIVLRQGLPGVPVNINFDSTRWELVEAPNDSNDHERVVLRSLRPGVQRRAELNWNLHL
jgi:hypothetical protein